MDPRIQAALIAAICTIIGVLIGGVIQSHLRSKDIAREKRVAEGAVCLYLCQLRHLFRDFSKRDATYKCLALGITANQNNISEIEKVIELIEKHDAFLVVKLFNIRQRMHNINLGSKQYHKLVKNNPSSVDIEPTVGIINVDGKHGLKEVDMCIKHAFNNCEATTKSYLLKNEDFEKFLAEVLGNSLYQKARRKLGLTKRI